MEFREVHGVKVSRCGVVVGKRGKPLKPADNGRGYLIVTVRVGGIKTCKGVHRLVAEAWVENPNNLPEVNHKDCNKLNNCADNLEWCTRGYNIGYTYETEGRSATGENNARCRATEIEVKHICELLQQGLAAATIRDKGHDYSLVRAIKSRKNWSHISKDYTW